MKKANWQKLSNKSGRSSKAISPNKLLLPPVKSFLRRFQAHAAETLLLPKDTGLIVAVSGGPDSMALLKLLSLLQSTHNWRLHIVHVNYGLRGKDSTADAALVKSVASELGLAFSVLRSRVKPKKNIEESLRDIRYAYFEQVRREKKFDLIVTAHQANDFVETFLMNLIRGSGRRGFTPFRGQPRVIRPLLPFTRIELLNFLHDTNTPFRLDKTNTDLAFTRNRIRHLLLPLLQKEFNPNIIATLARGVRLFEESGSAVTPLLIVEKKKGQTYAFDRQIFLELPEPQRRLFLSHFFRTFLGQSPSEGFLHECHKAIRSTKGKVQTITKRDLKIRVLHARVETTFLSD